MNAHIETRNRHLKDIRRAAQIKLEMSKPVEAMRRSGVKCYQIAKMVERMNIAMSARA